MNPIEPCTVRFTKAAQRDFDRFSPQLQERIVKRLRRLATEPYTTQSEKLSGRDDIFRVRIGNYRVLYSFETTGKIVWIIRIAHRREVYR